MGVAYYVVVDTDNADFDTTIDGKGLSRNANKLDLVATSLGFKTLDSYFSISPTDARTEMAGLLGIEDENDLPPESEEALKQMPPEEWHEAQLGLDYATQVSDFVREHPDSVDDVDAVLEDLEQMRKVMLQLQQRGLKWHLQVDY